MSFINNIEKVCIVTEPVNVCCQPEIIIPLCRKPYYKHLDGCPNLNRRHDCPPRCGIWDRVYESRAKIAAVRFDFSAYKAWRRRQHPDWTPRQIENPYYWQGHVRKHLREVIEKELQGRTDLTAVTNPEGMGVNLTKTCQRGGIELEWPPDNYVYKVALLAKEK